MTNPQPHPDAITDYRAFKAIQLGGNQAIEDKAIAEYMRAYKELGKAGAERVFFEHFKKTSCGK